VAALDDAKNAFIRTQNASIVALLAQYPTKTFKRIAQDLALVSAVKLKRGQNKWATYCANIAKQQRGSRLIPCFHLTFRKVARLAM
jgi:hypothetical protein